jgi:hypothetical protein
MRDCVNSTFIDSLSASPARKAEAVGAQWQAQLTVTSEAQPGLWLVSPLLELMIAQDGWNDAK